MKEEELEQKILRFAKALIGERGPPLEAIVPIPGSGALTNKYYIIGKSGVRCLFVRITNNKERVFEAEYPERSLWKAIMGQRMARDFQLYEATERPGAAPECEAVALVTTKGDIVEMPSVFPGTRVLEIYRSEPGKTLLEILSSQVHKVKADSDDGKRMRAIVRAITIVHNLPYRSSLAERGTEDRKALYEDHIETIFQMAFMHRKFGTKSIFPTTERRKVVDLMQVVAENLLDGSVDTTKRLSKLVGDFTPSNVMFDVYGNAFIRDQCRFPYGERGFDVGWWWGHFLWLLHAENNPYYGELNKLFIEGYQQERGGVDLPFRMGMALALGVLAFVKFNPRFRQKIAPERGQAFIEDVIGILEKGSVEL